MAHVVFLPYTMNSHITPIVHIARLFAFYGGLKITIIATPKNALLFQSSVDKDCLELGSEISVKTVKFPADEVDLPEGVENIIASPSMEIVGKVCYGFTLLQKPMEQLIRQLNPQCIVSDMFFPWTVDLAEELKIPRYSFQPATFIHQCAWHFLKGYTPHMKVASDSERFLIPGLPHEIKMKRSEIEDFLIEETDFSLMVNENLEAELRSYGIIHNTCSELEPGYAEVYKKVRGRKGWHIGPLSLFINNLECVKISKEISNSNSSTDPWKGYSDCLNWLEKQEHNSVLYVNFGSMVRFPNDQLSEIALALEAANCPFIWVVREQEKNQEDGENGHFNWWPNGFKENIVEKNKMGLIIQGWAPQVLILKHRSIGGFLTHCGWNSILEALTVGLPLITWPLFSENFYSEKLLEQLGLGIGVGADVWNSGFIVSSPVVSKEKLELAIKCLMCDSEKSREIRQNAKLMAEKLKSAAEEGGSSHSQLIALIEEIKSSSFKNFT
ncbi:nuatigenin 3-beta-glucosyltransferase-like [Nicotiana tabacum]|uniref:Glycosyltransferase n=1 Tax=Nicotiana tabacum TaxID=4097 RepID=A0A1S4DL60_TOBAC|nr:PREDICTED: scopoletin glucosyltransferase-like [Nicotiana tabacum]WIW42842.1 UDP-glycosyltransferase [Nicotiana tabacum]